MDAHEKQSFSLTYRRVRHRTKFFHFMLEIKSDLDNFAELIFLSRFLQTA